MKPTDERLREMVDDIQGQYYSIKEPHQKAYLLELHNCIAELATSRQTIKRLVEDNKALFAELSPSPSFHRTNCPVYRLHDADQKCTCGYRDLMHKHTALMAELKEEK